MRFFFLMRNLIIIIIVFGTTCVMIIYIAKTLDSGTQTWLTWDRIFFRLNAPWNNRLLGPITCAMSLNMQHIFLWWSKDCLLYARHSCFFCSNKQTNVPKSKFLPSWCLVLGFWSIFHSILISHDQLSCHSPPLQL